MSSLPLINFKSRPLVLHVLQVFQRHLAEINDNFKSQKSHHPQRNFSHPSTRAFSGRLLSASSLFLFVINITATWQKAATTFQLKRRLLGLMSAITDHWYPQCFIWQDILSGESRKRGGTTVMLPLWARTELDTWKLEPACRTRNLHCKALRTIWNTFPQ